MNAGARVKIRITKTPDGTESDFDLAGFRVGEVYDISGRLALYLIVAGYAVPEMRSYDRPPAYGGVERRIRRDR